MRVAKTPKGKPGQRAKSRQKRQKAKIEVVEPSDIKSLKYTPTETQVAQKKLLDLLDSGHFEANRAYDLANIGAHASRIGMLYVCAARRMFDEILGGECNGEDFITYCRRASDEYEMLEQFGQIEKKQKAELVERQREPTSIDKSSRKAFENSLKGFLSSQGIVGETIDLLCTVAAGEHFANAARDPSLPIKLPKRLEIPLYERRPNRKMNPIDFYNTYWKPYADAGLLYQHILSRYDPKIIQAIRNYCHRYRIETNGILPPTQADINDRELDKWEKLGLTPKDLIRLASVAARREAKEAANQQSWKNELEQK